MSEPSEQMADRGERKHHPDCPAPYFPDRTDRCRCMFMAMLDRAHRPTTDTRRDDAAEPEEGER